MCTAHIFFPFLFLAAQRGMRDLSSPTRDQNWPLHWVLRVLTTGPPGKNTQLFLICVY